MRLGEAGRDDLEEEGPGEVRERELREMEEDEGGGRMGGKLAGMREVGG